MPQLTLYLDEATNDALARAASQQRRSRSALAQEAIRLLVADRFPDWWVKTLGGMDDPRSPEEILEDIRSDLPERELPQIE